MFSTEKANFRHELLSVFGVVGCIVRVKSTGHTCYEIYKAVGISYSSLRTIKIADEIKYLVHLTHDASNSGLSFQSGHDFQYLYCLMKSGNNSTKLCDLGF